MYFFDSRIPQAATGQRRQIGIPFAVVGGGKVRFIVIRNTQGAMNIVADFVMRRAIVGPIQAIKSLVLKVVKAVTAFQ